MSTDEHQILEFLKTKTEFCSVREVSKRIAKRRSQKDPTWAKPCLVRLANGGHILMNDMGHFRYLPPEEEKKKQKQKLHVAPHIAEILARSGKAHLTTTHELSEEQ